MKTIKSFLGIFAFTALVASCLSNEESYQAGFVVAKPTSNGLNVYYANNTGDSLVFFGYGNWAIDNYQFDGADNSWIDVTTKKGKAAVLYSQELAFEQNTTGVARYGGIRIFDTDHSDAYAPIVFYQYATRGDGSLGSAADVREISGTDGSLVELAYDAQHRPLTVRITKNGTTLQDLTIRYSKLDSTMTVKDKASDFTAKLGRDYQPNLLTNKQLFFFEGGQRVGNLELTYSANDNRCQSIDANQLVRGVEECDPYLLASLFRYTRSTSILKKAKGKQGEENVEYNVSTTLNNDKSIHTMTVSKGAESITYTFNY